MRLMHGLAVVLLLSNVAVATNLAQKSNAENPEPGTILEVVSPLESDSITSFRLRLSASACEGACSSSVTHREIIEIFVEDSTARTVTATTEGDNEELSTAFWADGLRFTQKFAGLWMAEMSGEGPQHVIPEWIDKMNQLVGQAIVMGQKSVGGRPATYAKLDKNHLKRLAETDEIREQIENYLEEFEAEFWVAPDSLVPLKYEARMAVVPDESSAHPTTVITQFELLDINRKQKIDLPDGRLAWPGVAAERFDERTFLANLPLGVAETVTLVDASLLAQGLRPVSSQIEDDWTWMVYDRPEGRLEVLVAPIDEPPAKLDLLHLDSWKLFGTARKDPIRQTGRGTPRTNHYPGREEVETVPGSVAMMLWLPASDEDEVIRLREAIVTGATEVAATILATNPELLEAGIEKGRTPLLLAMSHDRGELVRLLIDSGADVNADLANGFSCLHLAAGKGDVDMVRLLLSAGADVNPGTDGEGPDAPLIRAAEKGHLEVVRLLLDAGARIEAKNRHGFDSLMQSTFEVQEPVMLLLLERGANPNATNVIGLTALHGATRGQHPELVRPLLDAGADPNLADDSGRTPMFNASIHGPAEVVSMLIARGGEVRIADKWSRTPLHEAARGGSADVVALLLKHGADVDARDGTRCTPLMRAADRGSPASVETLLEHGSDVNAKSENELTPLIAAIRSGRVELAERLVAAGAKVDEVDTSRILANDSSAHAPKTGSARRLITYADLMFRIGKRDQVAAPLRQALGFLFDVEESPYWDTDELFRRCPVGRDFGAAISELNPEMISLLLDDRGREPSAGDETVSMLAFCSAQYGNLDLLERLYAAGLDVEDPDASVHVLILHAVAKGQVDVVAYLLARGASIETRRDDGATPLIIAAGEGHTAVVELLISSNADLSARDVRGIDAHGSAAVSGHLNLARLLRTRGATVEASDIEYLVGVLRGEPGRSSSTVARSTLSLATLALEIEQYDLATRLYRQSIDQIDADTSFMRDRDNATELVIALLGLARSQIASAEYIEAHAALERALTLTRRQTVRDYERIQVLLGWSTSLYGMGDYAGARPHLERALELAERTFGPKHPATRACLIRFGRLLTELNESDTALQMHQRARELIDGSENVSDAEREANLYSMGMALTSLGQFEEAKEIFQTPLERSELGEDRASPEVALALYGLGSLLLEQGAMDEAERRFREALTITEEIDGFDSVALGKLLTKLGRVLSEKDEVDAAKQMVERAVQIYTAAFGAERPITLAAREQLRGLGSE